MIALLLSAAALRAEFGGARDWLAAIQAEFCFRGWRGRCCWTTCRCGWACSWRRRLAGLHGVHHALRHRETCAQSDSNSRCATAFIGGRDGHRLRYLVLRVLAHVADHIHANALIQNFLELVWQ